MTITPISISPFLLRTFPFGRSATVVVLAAVFLLPLSVGGSQYTERLKNLAQSYYYGTNVTKDLNRALRLYLKAAEQGDTEAQYIAGGMYYRGFGAPQDLKKAFSLLYGAAVEGSSTPQSQKLLGQFFLTGTTIPQNLGEAMKWYLLAAENGDREAQSELAFLYFTGRGGERNVEKSFFWYEKSALQGLAVAQYSLGIMYYSGNGAKEADIIKAYAWISLAAAQNHADALAARSYIESLLSADELLRAQDYALQLYRQLNAE